MTRNFKYNTVQQVAEAPLDEVKEAIWDRFPGFFCQRIDEESDARWWEVVDTRQEACRVSTGWEGKEGNAALGEERAWRAAAKAIVEYEQFGVGRNRRPFKRDAEATRRNPPGHYWASREA